MKHKLIVLSACLSGLFASAAYAAPDCVGTQKPFFEASEVKWEWNENMKAYEHMVCGDAKTPGKPFVQMLKFPPNYAGKRHNHPIDRVVMVQGGKWISTTYDGPKGAAEEHVLTAGMQYYEPAYYDHSFMTGPEGAIIYVLGWSGPTRGSTRTTSTRTERSAASPWLLKGSTDVGPFSLHVVRHLQARRFRPQTGQRHRFRARGLRIHAGQPILPGGFDPVE